MLLQISLVLYDFVCKEFTAPSGRKLMKKEKGLQMMSAEYFVTDVRGSWLMLSYNCSLKDLVIEYIARAVTNEGYFFSNKRWTLFFGDFFFFVR